MAMADESKMGALLADMPRIAKAVNAFTSESVQQQAFSALIAAFEGGTPPTSASGSDHPRQAPPRKRPRVRSAARGDWDGNASATPARRRGGSPKRVKDLNLAPGGKKSLKMFVEEKQPKTNHDRSLVSLFYLVEVAKVKPIAVDHIHTCYLDMNWRLPAQFTNSLAVTASKKGYFDTSSGEDIKLTPSGLNRVNHDLPSKPKQ
jgi:hypothetical protein